MEYIVGIDIGTGSTKGKAFDRGGKVIAGDSASYPTLKPAPAYFEQDPEEIFQAVLNVIRSVASRLKSKNIAAVSFSSAMHSVIAVNRDGKALTKSIIWADARSTAISQRIKAMPESHAVYLRTGTPLHPMAPLSKLLWIRENQPDIFGQAYKFISIKEYVLYKLFGEFVVDYSIASATGLFDTRAFKWHEKALAMAGVEEKHLSRPVPVTYMLKSMKGTYARVMGISPQTPFVIGGSDGCLANLGSQAIGPGEATVTIGTSGAIRVASDKPFEDEKERLFSYILTEKIYICGGPVNNGGNALLWFLKNFMGHSDPGDKDFEQLFAMTGSVPPGAEGLLFLPYLFGERAPVWDASAKGLFFGVSHHHTRAHFARALLEGLIFNIYSIARVIEEAKGKINRIHASGGFVRSRQWLHILSDIFNKEVLVSSHKDSAALGAAIIGWNALGTIDSLEEFKGVSPVSHIQPDSGRHTVYKKYHDIFRGLFGKLKDDMVKIQALQADHTSISQGPSPTPGLPAGS